MDEKQIIALLTDKYAIAAVVTVILFYFTIRGQKRSANIVVHLARVCAACALVVAISLCARELADKFGISFINPNYIDIFQRVDIVLILMREAFWALTVFATIWRKAAATPRWAVWWRACSRRASVFA